MDLIAYFISFYISYELCSAFNFETRLPVIKIGDVGSYFGFSVAPHQSQEDGKLKSWLLVGAPLDQNLQPGTNHSGALWKCPISTYYDDCKQVITDGRKSFDSDELIPPLEDEIKEGQWLGVTVRSGGKEGKILVCAHRYVKEEEAFGRGLCYLLSQTYEFERSLEPCKGLTASRAQEEYGYCQFGTSGIIVNETAVGGSPGTYNWRGTVFVYSVSDDYLHRDKNVYNSPHMEYNSPVAKDSYLGMSVAAADFFNTGSIAYATGAPRSNGVGEVLIFVKNLPFLVMKEKCRLTGEMFTSNFGYELATADVNGDGLPDLIVGAPNYFEKDAGGAVYIYINKNEKCSLLCDPPIKIIGKNESRFGIAITNLGDINKDGYDDIAVGAPYENNGVVYVYLGSKKGTNPEPSQIIHAEEIEQFGPKGFKLTTFGYSLSGGLDLDENDYPDLLIGAYESQTAVLLRTRPIIQIESKIGPSQALRQIDPKKPGCKKYPDSKLTCFTFEVCITVHEVFGNNKLDFERFSINFTLKADINKKVPRVSIQDEKSSYQINPAISFRNDSFTELKHCKEFTVFIQENIKDIQTAVAMRLRFKLVQNDPEIPRPGEAIVSLDALPSINQVETDKIFEASFLKDCGDDEICESQLTTEASLSLPSSDGSRKYDFIVGEHKSVLLTITVHNSKESAYESSLLIKHSPSLSFISQVKGGSRTCEMISKKDHLECDLGNPFGRNVTVQIQLKFKPHFNDEYASAIRIFEIATKTTSKQLIPQEPIIFTAVIIRKANLSMKASVRPEKLFYDPQALEESNSEVIFKDQLGPSIRHIYQVVNNGPSPVASMKININWPLQLINEKYLLYMDEEPSIDVEGGGHCSIGNFINPLGLKDRKTYLNLKDRKTYLNNSPSMIRKRRISNSEDKRIVSLNCTSKEIKCISFQCTIYKLLKQQSATITIKSRFCNSTMAEDYPKAKSVEITSQAMIDNTNFKGLIITSQLSELSAYAISVANTQFHDQQTGEDQVSWWISVAVIIGLLIFAFCVFILWKCGFFKRYRPDPTLTGNLQKNINEYYD